MFAKNLTELTRANVDPSLSVAGHDLYISNDRSQTFGLEASKTYKEVRRNRLRQGSGASLYFDGAEAFIRVGESLYCIGPPAKSLDAPGKRGG